MEKNWKKSHLHSERGWACTCVRGVKIRARRQILDQIQTISRDIMIATGQNKFHFRYSPQNAFVNVESASIVHSRYYKTLSDCYESNIVHFNLYEFFIWCSGNMHNIHKTFLYICSHGKCEHRFVLLNIWDCIVLVMNLKVEVRRITRTHEQCQKLPALWST